MNQEHESLLLSRVVDRSETCADWDELQRAATQDRHVFDRLAAALREDTRFRGLAGAALDAIAAAPMPMPVRPRRVLRGAARCAVACALLVAAFAAGRVPTADREPAPATADAALQHYLRLGQEAGRIVDLLPNVTLSTQETADGKALEVLFLRRVVERTVVDEAFRLGTDEHGRPITSPASLASFKPPSSM